MRVSEIRVKQIRVNQGLGVYSKGNIFCYQIWYQILTTTWIGHKNNASGIKSPHCKLQWIYPSVVCSE